MSTYILGEVDEYMIRLFVVSNTSHLIAITLKRTTVHPPSNHNSQQISKTSCQPLTEVLISIVIFRIFRVVIFGIVIFRIVIFRSVLGVLELGLIVVDNHVNLTLRLLGENLVVLSKGFDRILSCARSESPEAQVAAHAPVAAAITAAVAEVAPETAARATVTAAHATSAHVPTTTTAVPGAATTTAVPGAATTSPRAAAATALPRLSCDHLSLLLNIRFVSDEIGSLVSHSSEDSSKALDGFRDGDGRFLRMMQIRDTTLFNRIRLVSDGK